MRRSILAICFLVLFPHVAFAAEDPTRPRIVGVYPNPVAYGDPGEFLVVEWPPGYDRPVVIDDGESRISLEAPATAGRIAYSTRPKATAKLIDVPVSRLDPSFQLANAGETITLFTAGKREQQLQYQSAPEGEQYILDNRHWQWRPIGLTVASPNRVGPTQVEAFVLPDTPSVPKRAIANASRRIYLAGYTYATASYTDILIQAKHRGVDVRLLLEADPVGGISRREAAILDRLVAGNVTVRLLAREPERFAFHHPKYAVVDDSLVVATENWKPSGIGGAGNRGWGVVLHPTEEGRSPGGAGAEIFIRDWRGHDAVTWQTIRPSKTFSERNRSGETYPSVFRPRRVASANATLITAPDNAEGPILAHMRTAQSSIRIVQMDVDSPAMPFMAEAIEAARRGVKVKVLVSSAWYAKEDNSELVRSLEAIAKSESIPLSAKLVSPDGRFKKIHAKGVIIDQETVIVSSINWNNNSLRANRELGVIIENRAIGQYYASIFDADWRLGGYRILAGLLGATLLAMVLAIVMVKRSVRFEKTV